MHENLIKRIIESLRGTKFVQTRMGEFIFGVLTELDTVTWPSKSEVYNSTMVVLVAVAFFSAYSGMWDFFMSLIRHWLFTA